MPTSAESGPLAAGPAATSSPFVLDEESDDAEEEVTRLYLSALRHPAPSRAALVAEGIAAETIDAYARVLTQRGVLDASDEEHWYVPPPDIVLRAYAANLEDRARRARGAATQLAQVYFTARQDREQGSSDAVRPLVSQQEISAASVEIMSRVHGRVAVMRTDTPRTRALLASPHPANLPPPRAADGRAVETLAVYDVSVLDVPSALDTLQLRHRAGERVRLATQVPFSLLVVDEAAALVDVGNVDPSGAGSLLVRAPSTVRALRRLVDDYWARGTQLAMGEEGPGLGGRDAVDRRDLSILRLLAAGATDATIARQEGVSQRTVERRVRSLMSRFGVATRFQAGVQASRRGLV